jgi:hypothetical protein
MAVPPPLLRPFEEEIVRKWRGEEVPERWRFGTTAVSPKGEWVKGFLRLVGSAYVKQMFEEWKAFTGKAKMVPGTPSFRVGTYVSFRNYVRILSSLNLIRLVKTEPGPRIHMPRQFERHFYALNMRKIDAPEWRHPMQARYPSVDWADKRYFPTVRKKKIRREVKLRKREKKAKAKLLRGK